MFSYMTGQLRPHHAALLAAFEAESATAVADHAPDLDVRYAPHPRARFDFFRAKMADAASCSILLSTLRTKEAKVEQCDHGSLT